MRQLAPTLLMLALALLTPVCAQAQSQPQPAENDTGELADDVYPLSSRTEQERFNNLLNELRCPKCQNQNIADSDAPIASDMREEVYRMVREGASNDEVVGSLVARFGEFVRYKPEFDRRTAFLWLLPAIVVTIGVLVVVLIVVRSRRASTGPERKLTEEQRRRADQLLRRDT